MKRGRQVGYTMLELVLGAALLILVVAGASSVFRAADGQVKSNRVRIRAATEHRRNLEAVANVLRDADITTLSGFDANWIATTPSFSRVQGADNLARTLSETLRLEWRAVSTQVDGISSPGAVYLVGPSGQQRIADRVPANGFSVRQDGNTLVITISTYYATRDRRTTVVTGETAVTLRN